MKRKHPIWWDWGSNGDYDGFSPFSPLSFWSNFRDEEDFTDFLNSFDYSNKGLKDIDKQNKDNIYSEVCANRLDFAYKWVIRKLRNRKLWFNDLIHNKEFWKEATEPYLVFLVAFLVSIPIALLIKASAVFAWCGIILLFACLCML